MNNDLPLKIEAFEAQEVCGSKVFWSSIIITEDGDEICRIQKPTERERKIAMLWAASPQLLEWAKEACEAERHMCDNHDDDSFTPSWLPELEAAVEAAQKGITKDDKEESK